MGKRRQNDQIKPNERRTELAGPAKGQTRREAKNAANNDVVSAEGDGISSLVTTDADRSDLFPITIVNTCEPCAKSDEPLVKVTLTKSAT